jgi:hypothetical protein
MNLKSLTKEQQQKYALLAIVGIAAIFALKQFAVSPLLASHARSRAELRELEGQLEQAEAVIKRDDEIAGLVAVSSERMSLAARDLIPSPDNALAWATKNIYAHARALGIDIEAVSDLDADTAGFTSKEQEKLVFKPYGVRVVTQCSYVELLRLIEALETSNPHVSISGIAISGQLSAPEHHQILLGVEWPSWKKAEKSRPYLSEAKHEKA